MIINFCEDLKATESFEVFMKLYKGQFAPFQIGARWQRKALNGRRGQIVPLVAIDDKLTPRVPSVRTAYPSGMGVDPIGVVRRSRSGSDLAWVLQAGVRRCLLNLAISFIDRQLGRRCRWEWI